MSKRTTIYTEPCREALTAIGHPEIDPRWLEGSMRLQYDTLDHLDGRTFKSEARVLMGCLREEPDFGEQIAQSYGL